ncbi:MAG: hypothetical protein D6820_02875, partial [Lentisphaerae bacterium]
MIKNVIFLFLTCLLVQSGRPADRRMVPRNRLPQGGGVIYPAWKGEYWSNPEFRGKPAWTRSDIRIRFDWEDWRPVLGVRAESVRNFPIDNFSVRWTGTIIARFNEKYTFKLISDERARLKIRPEGASQWQTLIDAWQPHRRRLDKASITLSPGIRYDVVVEYVDLSGDAVCILKWESPGTPEEVIDYVSGNSVHFMIPHVFADLFCFAGRPQGFPAKSAEAGNVKCDENGWPAQDFSRALLQGFSFYTGRGLISFKGLAEVSISGATFEVNGKKYSTLPKGVGYDPATNKTRAFVMWAKTKDNTAKSVLKMQKTQRSPKHPLGSGVTDLHVMLSRHVNGLVPHEPGEIINQETRDAFLPVFTFRVQQTGLNDIVQW